MPLYEKSVDDIKNILLVIFISSIIGLIVYLFAFAYPDLSKKKNQIEKQFLNGMKVYSLSNDNSIYLIPRNLNCGISLFSGVECKSNDIDIGIYNGIDKFITFGKINDFSCNLKSFNLPALDIDGALSFNEITFNRKALSDFLLLKDRPINDNVLEIAEKNLFNQLQPLNISINVKMSQDIKSHISLNLEAPILNYNLSSDFILKHIEKHKIVLKIPDDLMESVGYSEIDGELPELEFYIKNSSEKLTMKKSFKDFAYELYVFNSTNVDLTQYNHILFDEKIDELIKKDDFEVKVYPYIDKLLVNNKIPLVNSLYKTWKNEYFSDKKTYNSIFHSEDGFPMIKGQYISKFGNDLFERVFENNFSSSENFE